MIERYRTWIHLWRDYDGNHCVISKAFVKDGRTYKRDFFFRPSDASVARLSDIVYSAVDEGKVWPSVAGGIGWSWKKGVR